MEEGRARSHKASLLWLIETRSVAVAQASLELEILPHPHPRYPVSCLLSGAIQKLLTPAVVDEEIMAPLFFFFFFSERGKFGVVWMTAASFLWTAWTVRKQPCLVSLC